MEYWNDGIPIKETNITDVLHYSKIPTFHYSSRENIAMIHSKLILLGEFAMY